MTHVARGYLEGWTPDSWRQHTALHQPTYPDQNDLASTLSEIQCLPPLVSAAEVMELRKLLTEAARGRALVVQAGDCAESFAYCYADRIDRQSGLIARMADVIAVDTNFPVIRIGRIAGQYAKPRSSQTEIVKGKTVLSFFGENVNDPSPDNRSPDPRRLKQGYLHAAATAKHLRVSGCGTDLFLSHEALLLPLEEAMTRYDHESGTWYNGGAHMLWIGERTRDLKHAHVAYARGISNPIGIKVGPTADAAELLALIRLLNPSNDAGKIILITRLGDGAEDALHRLIPAVTAEDLQVLWLSDPMHGNTRSSPQGIKTRLMSDIVRELEVSVRTHREFHSLMHGLHLEVAAEDVTECVGGDLCNHTDQLTENYRSLCDPRLNPEQAVSVCRLFAKSVRPTAGGDKDDFEIPSVSKGDYYAERACGK